MKINLFGCSHTDLVHNSYFKKEFPTSCCHATAGFSNFNIINSVYEFIENGWNPNEDILVIQYTYTNRWWIPNNLPYNNHGFHSFDTNHAPIYKHNPSFMKDDLLKFYELYITYFWDYEPALKYLLQNITLLKSYLDSKGVRYIHYLWTDGGHGIEWKTNSIEKKNVQLNLIQKYKELNLEHIDNEYHWEKVFEKRGWLEDEDSGHVREQYQENFGKQLFEKINGKKLF